MPSGLAAPSDSASEKGGVESMELCREHSGMLAQVSHLEHRQEVHEGVLQTLQKDMNTNFAQLQKQLAEAQERSAREVGELKYWLMGVMASALLSVLGIIALLLNQ